MRGIFGIETGRLLGTPDGGLEGSICCETCRNSYVSSAPVPKIDKPGTSGEM